jgi:hypothetical protein
VAPEGKETLFKVRPGGEKSLGSLNDQAIDLELGTLRFTLASRGFSERMRCWW